MRIILASSSPRRIELLRRFISSAEVVKPLWETRVLSENPVDVATLTALEKARAVAGRFTSGLVIGADTIVVLGNDILGKPRDESEAKDYLRRLSGRVHKVITGLAIIDASSGREVYDYEVTEVKFKDLSDEEIDLYVASGEPMDKAGAYGIQGLAALFVEWIHGDFYNVVGLPLFKLSVMLRDFGVNLLELAIGGRISNSINR